MKKKLNSHKNTFTTSRELSRQQTRKVPISRDLFEALPQSERQHALSLDKTKGFLSSLVDGIDAGELGSKVIIAIAQILSEQSKYTNQGTELLGISDEIKEIFPEFDTEKYPIKIMPNGGEKTTNGQKTRSKTPYVWFELSQLTRRALGLSSTEKPRKADKDSVAKVIRELSNKVIYLAVGDGTHIGTSLCSIDYVAVNKRGSIVYILRLSSVFTREVMHDNIILRNDTLTKLRGKQSTMTMRLFWFLAEQNSYHKSTWPIDKIKKYDLFERIAIINSYVRHPDRKEPDFRKSILKMKEVGLLENSNEAYKEETNESGEIISIFKFNKSYLDD